MSESLAQKVEIVGVRHTLDVPAIRQKATRNIFGESQTGVSLDRDVVVVVDPTQVGQFEMAG